jgi:septum site-determining protein MinC
MAAQLIPASSPGLPHRLRLPDPQGASSAAEEVRYGLGGGGAAGPLTLEAHDWLLRLPDLRQLQSLLQGMGLKLERVISRRRETLVASSALGLLGEWPQEADPGADAPEASPRLTIPQGTLRSGDHLQAGGTLLLLGDVNPGARISAGGHVLVWGRLRGVAHAGRHGDRTASIVALQLRPLQLRIGDVVARGPQDTPPAGLAEVAHLVEGVIRIDPASPHWPLGDALTASHPQDGPNLR